MIIRPEILTFSLHAFKEKAMFRVHLQKGIVWEGTFLASFHSLPHNSSNELIDLGKPGAAFQKQVCAPEQTAHPDSSSSPPGTVVQPDPASEVLGGVQQESGEDAFTLPSIVIVARHHWMGSCRELAKMYTMDTYIPLGLLLYTLALHIGQKHEEKEG